MFAAVIAILLLGGTGAALAMPFEDSLIFYPDRDRGEATSLTGRILPAGPWVTQVEDVWPVTDDGVRLHGWFARPQAKTGSPVPPPEPQIAILYFHGNAGKLADRISIVLDWVELGFPVLAIDYRGYGRSEGKPSEKGLYKDAQAAWDYLTGPLGFAPKQVIVFGKSLGGGAGTDLAVRVHPGGLILQSTFTSIPRMASEIIPFMPRFLITTKMDSLSKIPALKCPLLVIHGSQDEVVPFWMGQELFEAAPEPKRFVEIRGARHNDTVFAPGSGYREAVAEFGNMVRRTPR